MFQNFFEKARIYFERSKDFDFQSMYMLSCMLYDGQGGKQDEVSCYQLKLKNECFNKKELKVINSSTVKIIKCNYCVIFSLFLQKLAVEYLKKIANSESKQAKHLKYPALFNIGRAYFQGFGVKQSDEEALR